MVCMLAVAQVPAAAGRTASLASAGLVAVAGSAAAAAAPTAGIVAVAAVVLCAENPAGTDAASRLLVHVDAAQHAAVVFAT